MQAPKPSKPAQVPGDAESPPRSEPDRTAERAIRHPDRTEPVQSPNPQPTPKPGSR